MKSCPHCAASLEEDAVKCSRCGKWIVQKRDAGGARRKRDVGRKRLILLALLILFAWALWALPETPFNPREILDLKPTLAATLDAMESDLETLIALQVEYFESHGSYSGSTSVLGFQASEGVTVSFIVTPTGWSATSTHEEFPPDVGCAVYGGSAAPPRSPISPPEPGVVVCAGRGD